MSTLHDRIDDLSAEEALEAVNLLAGRLLGAAPDDAVLAMTADSARLGPEEVRSAVDGASVREVTALSRLALHEWASTSPGEVEDAIEGTGQKAFILEAAVIGSLALGALSLYFSRGKAEVTDRTTTTIAADGTVEVVTETTTRYASVGESLGAVLGEILKHVVGGG